MHAVPDDAVRGQRAAAAVKCNVLVSSHDHQLVQTVANRIFDFTSDGKLIDRRCTYEEYLETQLSHE